MMCAHCEHVSVRDDDLSALRERCARLEEQACALKSQLAHANDDLRRLTDHAAGIEADLMLRMGMLLSAPTFELGKVDVVRVDGGWNVVGRDGNLGSYATLESAWAAAQVLR